MYQFALVKMLHNTQTNRWHPIFYYDSPLPGGFDEGSINNKALRYKSKGHHTTGFDNRPAAVDSANELISQLKEQQHDTVTVEIDEKDDLIWADDEMPTDVQLRPFPEKQPA